MKKLFSGLSLLTIIFFFSCTKATKITKEEEPKVDPKVQLTTGRWKLSAATYQTFTDGKGGIIEDEFSAMKGCEKDNIYKFNTDGTITDNEGKSKCTDTTYDLKKLSWKIPSNDSLEIERKNNYMGAGYNVFETHHIDLIDKKTLKLKYSHNGGTTYRYETITTYENVD